MFADVFPVALATNNTIRSFSSETVFEEPICPIRHSIAIKVFETGLSHLTSNKREFHDTSQSGPNFPFFLVLSHFNFLFYYNILTVGGSVWGS